jgi:hypothetical protein
MNWNEHNEWEKSWWGDCTNSIGEEIKQLAYIKKLGLSFTGNEKTPYIIDLKGASVVDVGGGPVSILLKTYNAGIRIVVDPCPYPKWVTARYRAAGISLVKVKAEEMTPDLFPPVDECWMYNCLQHVDDPSRVVSSALSACKVLRVCEAIGTRVTDGHPHSFTAQWLDDHLGGEGKVEHVKEHNIYGFLYFGVFKGGEYTGAE